MKILGLVTIRRKPLRTSSESAKGSGAYFVNYFIALGREPD